MFAMIVQTCLILRMQSNCSQWIISWLAFFFVELTKYHLLSGKINVIIYDMNAMKNGSTHWNYMIIIAKKNQNENVRLSRLAFQSNWKRFGVFFFFFRLRDAIDKWSLRRNRILHSVTFQQTLFVISLDAFVFRNQCYYISYQLSLPSPFAKSVLKKPCSIWMKMEWTRIYRSDFNWSDG